MDTTLAASLRTEETGKGAARRLRRTGQVPAVMYGPGKDPTPLSVDPVALNNLFKHTGDRNTVVQLQLEGKDIPVLVREVQRHPVSRQMLHVDFYQVDPTRRIETTVRIQPIGKPAGAVLGGRLALIRRVLQVRCPFDKIPAGFEIDVSALQIGDYVKVSEVPTPAGVEILFDSDFNVLACFGKRAAVVLPEDEEEEGEEGETSEGEGEGEGEGEA